jgi:hypothetical protein
MNDKYSERDPLFPPKVDKKESEKRESIVHKDSKLSPEKIEEKNPYKDKEKIAEGVYYDPKRNIVITSDDVGYEIKISEGKIVAECFRGHVLNLSIKVKENLENGIRDVVVAWRKDKGYPDFLDIKSDEKSEGNSLEEREGKKIRERRGKQVKKYFEEKTDSGVYVRDRDEKIEDLFNKKVKEKDAWHKLSKQEGLIEIKNNYDLPPGVTLVKINGEDGLLVEIKFKTGEVKKIGYKITGGALNIESPEFQQSNIYYGYISQDEQDKLLDLAHEALDILKKSGYEFKKL